MIKFGGKLMKYFEVVAKCGHVGRDHYYEGHFPVRAADKKQAARQIKQAPRVKKDHKDAILSVTEIDEKAYWELVAKHDAEPFFHYDSSGKQNFDDIKDSLRIETEIQFRHRELSKYNKDKPTYAKPSKYRGIRNPYRYNKLNKNMKIDDNSFLSDFNL